MTTKSEQLEKISQALDVPVIRFFEEKVEIDEEINNQQLLEIISQMTVPKRKILLNLIEFLQQIDFTTAEKAVELIHLMKNS